MRTWDALRGRLSLTGVVGCGFVVLMLFAARRRFDTAPLEWCALGAGLFGGIALFRMGRIHGWWKLLAGPMAVVPLLAGLLVIFAPTGGRVRESARRATCKCNLRQIGLACHMYADDGDQCFPPSFKDLFPDYIDNARIFACPSGSATWRDYKTGEVTGKSSDYAYVPGLRADMPGEFILAYEKSLDNHHRDGNPRGRNVLYADAHVDWWPAKEEAEFQARLVEQREALAGWRRAGARAEDIPRYLGRVGALTFLTYNVLASRERADERVPKLLALLEASGADVIALQEVTPWFVARLRGQKWVRGYRSAPRLDSRSARGGLMILSRFSISAQKYRDLESRQGRGVLAVRLKAGPKSLAVATVHLESPLESGGLRASQIEAVMPLLAGADAAVLLGDFNFGDGEEPETRTLAGRMTDMWMALHPEKAGYTWNMERSEMARRGSFPREKSRRLDRILFRCKEWVPQEVKIIGDSPVHEGRSDLFPSDHFGLVGVVRVKRK